MFFRIFGFFASVSLCISRTSVTVKTNVGSIMGFKEYVSVDGEQKLISKFLGIPFAESTAGQNRFMKPVPKAPFQGIFDARNVSLACYQLTREETTLLKETYAVSGFSEDCLTLNIYVPHALRSKDLLPVMVWIHGGGFTQGAASIYKPEVLALFGNVIVVTINYRLGMFGFLRDRNGAFPGNQGLWDQQLAIKWVHDNIDGFLGYNDEITIFGESAGGASVLLQAIYPGNKGLFKRVISQSGTAISPWALTEISDFESYMNEQSCLPDSKSFVTCLQSKNPASLQSNTTLFGPVVDGDFLVDTPRNIIKGQSANTSDSRDFFASLNIIVGVNNLDGAVEYLPFSDLLGHSDLEFNIKKHDFRTQIVPYMIKETFSPKDKDTKLVLEKLLTFFYTDWKDPDDYVSMRTHILDMSNDADYFAPASQTADAHDRLRKGKTFFYEFAGKIRDNFFDVPSWVHGSNHVDELFFVFGIPLSTTISMFNRTGANYTIEEKQVSRATMAFWSNFAKSGNPNIPMDVTQFTGTTWPEYNMASRRYFQISNRMSPASVMERFYPRRMAFWSNIIEKHFRSR